MRSEILLIGAGTMGGALLARWLETGVVEPADVLVVERSAERRQAVEALGVRVTGELPRELNIDVLVLAVKPQDAPELLQSLRAANRSIGFTISIMAGVPLATLAEACGEPVVRVMPNTPAQIGAGVLAWIPRGRLTAEQRSMLERLLNALGWVFELTDEALIDTVTAISGSGPAYVFQFLAALTDTATELGFDEPTARKLALMTVHGPLTFALSRDDSFEDLARAVTSRGGTTEAALAVLRDRQWSDILSSAIKAAHARSKALSR